MWVFCQQWHCLYFCLNISIFFVFRIDGKSLKPEQTSDETGVSVKETSSVVSSLYMKLLTEDLTSEGIYKHPVKSYQFYIFVYTNCS